MAPAIRVKDGSLRRLEGKRSSSAESDDREREGEEEGELDHVSLERGS